MGCLFCDQTPESVDAREKLMKIGELVGMASDPVMGVQSALTELTYEKVANAQARRDRDRWHEECNKLRKYIAYRAGVDRMLPEHYGPPMRSKLWGESIYDAAFTPIQAPEKPPEEKA